MKEEWKVYIRGNKDRGDDVIKALTDLGAANVSKWKGDKEDYIYFISHQGYVYVYCENGEVAKIIMDNYRELHLPEKWKDGDILVNKNADYKFCVFDDYLSRTCSGKDLFFFHCEVARHKGERYLNSNNRRYFHDVNDYRLATPQEVEQFHEALHKYHKKWDAEKKQLTKYRWKPRMGEIYWVVSANSNILPYKWDNDSFDSNYFNFGNCFKTKEEAEAMAEKIKKLLNTES